VTLFSPGGIEARDLDITTGSVVLDSGARQRGTVSFTCTDLDIVPPKREQASGESRPLHPFGSYLHVCYSMQTSRYNTRVVGVGVFRITSVRPNAKAGTVEVKAKDFALNLAESRFGYPITRQTWVAGAPIPATVLAAAQAIISEAGLAYRTPSSAATTVAVNYTNKKGDDRGAALDGLSTALGWVWYFDIDGVCYFGPPASLITDPIAYTFYRADPDRGQLSAQIIDQDQELIRDDTYDVVIASDQAGLYIGGAYDATPNSIIARSAANPAGLYLGAGPFTPGGKPYFVTSPVIASLADAQAAARTRLAGVALPAEQISATATIIPDLRPDKMVAMARDGGTDLVKWQVTKVTLPLAVGPAMSFEAVTIGEAVTPAS
jgi:hypothetical protein